MHKVQNPLPPHESKRPKPPPRPPSSRLRKPNPYLGYPPGHPSGRKLHTGYGAGTLGDKSYQDNEVPMDKSRALPLPKAPADKSYQELLKRVDLLQVLLTNHSERIKYLEARLHDLRNTKE